MARKTNRVLTTTEEEIKLIREENIELMDEFLEYLEATDHSPRSINVYKNNLHIFFVYCQKHLKNKDFVDIKKRDIMSFQNYMVKNNLGAARIKNIKSTLSSISNFIESVLEDEEPKWEGFRNIINKIPSPTADPVREKTILEDEDCQRLLDYLVENKKYQQACVFALAWASGRRKSELLRIKRSYITDETLMFGSLYKSPEKISTKGRGKMGKMLHAYILKSKFKKYYDLWMEERERLGVPDDIDDIFVSKKKDGWKPMKISTLDSWSDSFGKFLGVDFYFHCMRHNFCTSLCKANIPPSVIKDIIGWSSENMISIYNDTDISEEIGKYFSEDGIKEVQTGSLNNI